MPKQVAIWNSARDVWETPQTEGLFCEHLDVYSETFPTSGMTVNGVVYALPTWERHTDDSGYSSLLPTVTVSDTNGPGMHGDGGLDLRTAVSLFPTPRATDGEKGGPNQRGSSGDYMLPAIGNLLPTPKAGDADFASPMTSGRPVEKSTHLGTIALLQSGKLEHRRTGETMNLPSAAGKQLWDDVPLPLQMPQDATAATA